MKTIDLNMLRKLYSHHTFSVALKTNRKFEISSDVLINLIVEKVLRSYWIKKSFFKAHRIHGILERQVDNPSNNRQQILKAVFHERTWNWIQGTGLNSSSADTEVNTHAWFRGIQ